MTRGKRARGSADRWNAQHRGGRIRHRPSKDQWKIVHATVWGARWHQVRVWWRYGSKLSVYQCRWGDDYRDGETAPTHYHVGNK